MLSNSHENPQRPTYDNKNCALAHLEELTPDQVRAGTGVIRSYEEWQNIFKNSYAGRSLGVSHLFVKNHNVWVYRFLCMNVHRKQFPVFFTSLALLCNNAVAQINVQLNCSFSFSLAKKSQHCRSPSPVLKSLESLSDTRINCQGLASPCLIQILTNLGTTQTKRLRKHTNLCEISIHIQSMSAFNTLKESLRH